MHAIELLNSFLLRIHLHSIGVKSSLQSDTPHVFSYHRTGPFYCGSDIIIASSRSCQPYYPFFGPILIFATASMDVASLFSFEKLDLTLLDPGSNKKISPHSIILMVANLLELVELLFTQHLNIRICLAKQLVDGVLPLGKFIFESTPPSVSSNNLLLFFILFLINFFDAPRISVFFNHHHPSHSTSTHLYCL